MALKSGLAIYCYTMPASGTPFVREYNQEIMSLRFTTVDPGGYGDFSAILQLQDGRLPRPELAMFSRVVIMAGMTCVFLGEITDPALGLNTGNGSYVQITGLGIGNALRDDPQSLAYSNQTAKQIIVDQLTRRAAYLPIDQDTSGMGYISGATFAPVYDSRTMEEVIADALTLAGDYSWGVWAHPRNKDQAGFPTGYLVINGRDTTDTTYQASIQEQDITEFTITPSSQRAYNVIEIGYNAGNSGYGRATYTDSRLNADGSQGSAPFRRRKFVRDLSTITTVDATTAQSIASTYGAEFQNPTNKVAMTLAAARDPYGNRIPLWSVLAQNANIYVPELAVRGQQLATKATAGVNQFHILQTTYTESQSGSQLALQCDNFVDTANLHIARLQNESDLKARGGKISAQFQIQGAAETGRCGVEWSAATTGNPIGTTVNFRTIMVQAPTSITLSADATGNYNASSPSVSNIDVHGFHFFVTCNFTGGNQWGQWHGQYQTNGNTIRALDEAAGTLDWHCDRCDTVHIGLAIKEHIRARVHPVAGNVPGHTALAIDCPRCGMTECFNTNLTQEDEDQQRPGNYLHRATQARLIRRLMRHPQVGLEIRR